MGIRPDGFATEKKPRCLYFMVDNLWQAISKLQCRYFHVLAKNSFFTPSTRVHTANIEMRPLHYVVACKRLKTVENYYILSHEKWFWSLT